MRTKSEDLDSELSVMPKGRTYSQGKVAKAFKFSNVQRRCKFPLLVVWKLLKYAL